MALTVLATFLSLKAVNALPQIAISATSILSTSTAIVPGLDVLAKTAGKLYFGTAADNSELNDTAYDHILLPLGALTPANSMKREYSEPEPFVVSLTGDDQIAELAHTMACS